MAANTLPHPPRVTDAAAGPRRWRDALLLGGLLLLVLVGLGTLAAATGWEATKSAVLKLTLPEVALLLGLSLVNYFARGFRWHLFARTLGLPISLAGNLIHFLGGFAMSVTPGRIGELVRMRWIGRETGWSFDKTAPLVLVDRAADLAAMAILLSIGVAVSANGVAGAYPVALLGLIGAFMATRPDILKACGDALHRMTGRRLPKFFARVRRAARSLSAFNNPMMLVVAGLLGLVGWFAEGLAFHLLLLWMGADIGLWTAITIFTFATLAGGLTGAPGGLGGAEAAMVALLVFQNVPLEVAAPATLIIRVTTLWFAIAIGIGVFPIAEKQSKKAKHELEGN